MGWLLARRDFLGKSFVSMIVMAPLVVPPVVTGFLLLSVLGRESALGGMLAAVGLPIPFTLLGATLAALVVGFPLYVMAIRAVFDTVDRRFEEVSWTLGVPKAPTFRRISLPLALPGIAAGAVLAFARALGEFGATVVLAGKHGGRNAHDRPRGLLVARVALRPGCHLDPGDRQRVAFAHGPPRVREAVEVAAPQNGGPPWTVTGAPMEAEGSTVGVGGWGLHVQVRVPLDAIDLDVDWRPESDHVAILGPSGSGKSTLLRALAGLEPSAEGRGELR